MKKLYTLILVAVIALTAVACDHPPSQTVVSGEVAVTTTTTEPVVVPLVEHRQEALLSLPAPTTTTTTTPPPPTTTTAPPPPPTTTPPEIGTASYVERDCGGWGSLVSTYFPGQEATGCRVLLCESKGNPNAVSSTNDHGLMQIHGGNPSWPEGWRYEFKRVTGVDFYNGVYDPNLNMKMARHIYDLQGWGAWSCY